MKNGITMQAGASAEDANPPGLFCSSPIHYLGMIRGKVLTTQAPHW